MRRRAQGGTRGTRETYIDEGITERKEEDYQQQEDEGGGGGVGGHGGPDHLVMIYCSSCDLA